MPGLPTLKAPTKGRGSEQSQDSTPRPRIPKPVSPKDSAVKEAQKVSNAVRKKVTECRNILPELRKQTHQWPQEIATSLESTMSQVTVALVGLQQVMINTDDVDTILAKTSECSTLGDSMTEDIVRGKELCQKWDDLRQRQRASLRGLMLV